MKANASKLFVQLCESITEASTAMNLITGHPGGAQLVKKLHKEMQLAHDFEYTEVPKILWNDLKESYKGSWVIMRCTDGTAAIKASGGNTGSYDALVSDGGEIKSISDSRGGNIMDFIKSQVGKPIKFFVTRNTSKVRDLQQQRKSRLQSAGPQRIDNNVLVQKFKPLWARAITAAIADIKGHVTNMIKNDAFDKAKKKIDRVERLQNALDALEAGSQEATEQIKNAVQAAVLMTASHYYPDLTGDITRRYGGEYNASNSEGPTQLLKDLTAGDTAKLGTVLSFFKRALISG